jgi:hypothetical protein
MSRWNPCKRGDLVLRLRRLGFTGPFAGAKHQIMIFTQHRLAIPSNKEYSVPQLRMMLREVEEIVGKSINGDDWNALSSSQSDRKRGLCGIVREPMANSLCRLVAISFAVREF